MGAGGEQTETLDTKPHKGPPSNLHSLFMFYYFFPQSHQSTPSLPGECLRPQPHGPTKRKRIQNLYGVLSIFHQKPRHVSQSLSFGKALHTTKPNERWFPVNTPPVFDPTTMMIRLHEQIASGAKHDTVDLQFTTRSNLTVNHPLQTVLMCTMAYGIGFKSAWHDDTYRPSSAQPKLQPYCYATEVVVMVVQE